MVFLDSSDVTIMTAVVSVRVFSRHMLVLYSFITYLFKVSQIFVIKGFMM
jgi:hypothetical protein